MKKVLFSAAFLATSLLVSTAASAQATQAAPGQTKRTEKAVVPTQAENAGQNRSAQAEHGSTVSTLAQTTLLTGADKGATVSALASAGRSTSQSQRTVRSERSARGERSGAGRSAGRSHGSAAAQSQQRGR